MSYQRILKISNTETFFLWGPRQTGKSTLLRELFPDAHWIDLLHVDAFRRYTEKPEMLRHELALQSHIKFVVVDEIQKVPSLLDEIHGLIESHGMIFGLCGSSARKVKRGHANLLGGRAIRYELFGLVSQELAADFNLQKLLNQGYLPRHLTHEQTQPLLQSYIADYLKEEIAAEGLVRRLPAFSRFLDIAAIGDTEMLNFSTIARDCGVSSATIAEYFQILSDTLLGRFLQAYRKRQKRRLTLTPKFYFSDVGVVNVLARRGMLVAGTALFGKAFENWVHHELLAYNVYKRKYADLSYWRLPSGIEVDFIINDMQVAIEAKATDRISRDHLKGLRQLALEYPVQKRVVVSLVTKSYRTEDGIDVLSVADFTCQLWQDEMWR